MPAVGAHACFVLGAACKYLRRIGPYFRNNPRNLNKNLIHNLKPITDPLQNSGVYKLSCATCRAYYIGQTGRAFSVRCKEHFLRKNGSCPPNSSFADHLLISGHSPESIEKLEVLHVEKEGRKLDVWEELEIFKHSSLNDVLLLNEQL